MFCPKSSPSHLIAGPKRKALHLSIESSILGSLHRFQLFLRWANQIGSLQKKTYELFSFFPGSQCVHTMFPSSSQWVPIRFLIRSPSSQCVPRHVLHSTSLLSHMLWLVAKKNSKKLKIERERHLI